MDAQPIISQSSQPVPAISQSRPFNSLKLIIVGVALLTLGLIGGFFLGQKQLTQPTTTNTTPTISVLLTPTSQEDENISISATEKYKTANYGTFSYEYPAGWHVAELWPDENNDKTTIVMDPNPISTAPRGGPLGKFTIFLQNGKSNPDEIFQQEMARFNESNFKDIKKEVITGAIGEIYHFTGKLAGPYMEGEPVENYYFTFNKNPSDPLNQQIITAELVFNKDPLITEMFRHVVLSFKEINK